MTAPAGTLRSAPLRVITRREVLASRERLFLACGHAIERAYHGWSHRARCADCQCEQDNLDRARETAPGGMSGASHPDGEAGLAS